MSSAPQESTQSSNSSTPAPVSTSKQTVPSSDSSTSAPAVNSQQTDPLPDLSAPAPVDNSKQIIPPPNLSTSAPGVDSKQVVPPLAVSNKFQLWGMSLYEVLTLGIQAFGVVAALGTLLFLGRQIQDQSAATEAQTYQGVMDKQFELDKFFVDDPDLDLYFFKQPDEFEGKTVNRKDNKYQRKASSLADYYLDFFVMVWSQKDVIPELKNPTSESWQAWEGYMKATFKDSLVLCDKLNVIQKSYDKRFVQLVNEKKWCEGKLELQP